MRDKYTAQIEETVNRMNTASTLYKAGRYAPVMRKETENFCDQTIPTVKYGGRNIMFGILFISRKAGHHCEGDG